jgi:molybdopterin converting factor small subunit
MLITVEFAAQAKEAAGTETEEIDVPSPYSVQDIAEVVCRCRGDNLRSVLLDEEGTLHRSMLVLVNDSQVFHDETPEFADGDRVMFLTPVSGG